MTNNTAGTAGRLLGTAYAHTRHTVELIDWQEVGQIVIHGIVTIAVMTYLAGEYTGRTLHRLNDALSRVWVAAWVSEAEPAVEPAEAMLEAQTPTDPSESVAAPVINPLALLADDLQTLSCNQLRQLLGTKRRCSKRELVMLALAC